MILDIKISGTALDQKHYEFNRILNTLIDFTSNEVDFLYHDGVTVTIIDKDGKLNIIFDFIEYKLISISKVRVVIIGDTLLYYIDDNEKPSSYKDNEEDYVLYDFLKNVLFKDFVVNDYDLLDENEKKYTRQEIIHYCMSELGRMSLNEVRKNKGAFYFDIGSLMLRDGTPFNVKGNIKFNMDCEWRPVFKEIFIEMFELNAAVAHRKYVTKNDNTK